MAEFTDTTQPNNGDKLSAIAKEQRKQLITKNTFNGENDTNEYSSTHTRALSDKETPVNGKGTGIYMDTYNGGGDMDINGNPVYPGSGRKAAIAINQTKFGYTPTTPYTGPTL